MKKKINKKLMTFGILGVFALALVSAVAYYSFFTVTLNVTNPIQVTGDGDHILSVIPPEVVFGNMVRVDNNGDEDREIVITSYITQGSASNVEVNYVGVLGLTKKDTTTWQPTGNPITIKYTIVGDTFEYDDSNLPSGYFLVYAMDKENRFSDYANVIKLEDLNTFADASLPMSGDWNADCIGGVNGGKDYCDNHNGKGDNFEHCTGAKIWAIQSSDLGTETEEGSKIYKVIWDNMAHFYWETDLIHYFDNTNGEYTIGANSFVEFYPSYDFNQYADGTYIISTQVA